MEQILLCYITDRAALGPDERSRQLRLLEKIGEAARQGVDYIQLREKDLCGRELEALATAAMSVIRNVRVAGRKRCELLINSRTDIALASGANGVHLRSEDLRVGDVKAAWAQAGDECSEVRREPIVSVSCHSVEEVEQAAADGASVAVFAPVFEKEGVTPAGIDRLQQACQAKIPVLALGGVTLENAVSCLQAGAAGIAGIRLFQENDIGAVVRALRGR